MKQMRKAGLHMGNGMFHAHACRICMSMCGVQLDAHMWHANYKDVLHTKLASRVARSGSAELVDVVDLADERTGPGPTE
eukprot:15428223-Alexandrium_andersonii.AAC.1